MGGVETAGRGGVVRRIALVLSLALAVNVARPEIARAEEESFLSDVGIGIGTALVNVLYIPAKFTYATVGGVIGGLAYVLTLGDTDTAMGVWQPTMGGSYIVTPAMLRGEEAVEFSGEPQPQDEYYEDVSEEVEIREDVQIREYDTLPPAE